MKKVLTVVLCVALMLFPLSTALAYTDYEPTEEELQQMDEVYKEYLREKYGDDADKKYNELTQETMESDLVEAADYIQIMVNGKIVPRGDVDPEIVNDRTMVPIRLISEYLGHKVEWDEKTFTVTVVGKFNHKVGDTFVTMANGTKKDIGVASYIKDGRTMVSIRLFAEALDHKVDWIASVRLVTILTK